jgi:drug/metabolite transporter (DMT)-like permease
LNKNYSAHLALLFTNIFFAINFTLVKFLIGNGFVGAFGLNFLRAGVTVILLWLLYFIYPTKINFEKKDYGRLVLCALTGIAINQMLFVKGLSLTYSIHASLLMLSTPILITIIAAWLLKERINNFKIIGLVLGVAGALVLILSKEKIGNPPNVIIGDILVLLNAISYTFYFILVKPLMSKYNPVAVLRIIFTIGFFIMIPFCFQEFAAIQWGTFTPQAFSYLTVVIIGGTFFAYLFNIYGIKILGSSMAGSYIYTQPFFAAAIAIFIGGELLVLYKVIAGVLIFTGVYLVNKKKENARNNNS